VAFPDDVLTEQEEVVLHLHPHWKTTIGPVLLLLLALTATTVAWVMLPPDRGGHLAFGVVALIMLYYAGRYAIRPLIVRGCTHYVVTDERILLRHGVITRERRDLPLNRINDHAMTQTLLDRIFSSGTLTVDSIGDQAAVLTSVPRAHQVQTVLYELIEQDRERHPEDEEAEEDERESPAQRKRWF
jgi:uncharacterized membrane protein YdbT with pleckstrin-like domain